MRVVVAMSGGVDSSVAAAILRRQGYEVIGVTMRLPVGPAGGGAGKTCCSLEDVGDARRVAQALNIPFYVKDCHREFEAEVIDYFVAEYLRGRTPNPCIPCNQRLKFRLLLDWALRLGASHLATGHYARVVRLSPEGRWAVRRGVDSRKDQSYFLFNLTQEQLQRALFPLGDSTKEEVRAMARAWKLPVAEKAESQEICFVPDDDYPAFLQKKVLPGAIRPGPIVDREGKVLGRHRGLPFYTIGQRRGLGLAVGKPLYVMALRPEENTLVVGGEEELLGEELLAEDVHWMALEPIGGEGAAEPKSATVTERTSLEALVQVRYRHPGAEAVLVPLAGRSVAVRFRQAQRAITPGQAAVFYRDDLLLGGGWIQGNKAKCKVQNAKCKMQSAK